MKNVVIIGMGNIGFRHLQGALKSKNELNIYCVDPMGFDISKVDDIDRYSDKRIYVAKDCDNLPNDIDIAIIATTSDIRYSVFTEIIKKNVRNIIFEKVLFQRQELYKKTASILRENEIKAWVNCLRSVNPNWHKIKKMIDNRDFSLCLSGTDWGMACNTVHFLHLIDFLDGTDTIRIDEFNPKNGMEDSKRKGFKEFYGMISGHTQHCKKFIIECSRKNEIAVNIKIETNEKIIIIDEVNEKLNITDKNTDEKVEEIFPTLHVSKGTGRIIDDILLTSNCDLPDYTKSMNIHLQFIDAISGFFEENGFEKGLCPIT